MSSSLFIRRLLYSLLALAGGFAWLVVVLLALLVVAIKWLFSLLTIFR